MEEIWKDIPGYENFYQVSTFGRVRSFKRKKPKILKPALNRCGYLYVALSDSISRKKITIHRLVALTFIDNPLNKQQVNHIDEIKTNNNISNLEWVTPKENMNYGTRTERMIKSRETSPKWLKEQTIPVVAINIKTGERSYYKSMMEAERNGFHSGHISDCVRGIKRSHKGYKWFKQSEYKGVS
ncbi:NUMOD4 domain-containing protein [Mammaliicoccus sciuri]|uniref:NUMOD4 domain-containing protein n=1 Tax=Mammaliicoccus sciuri TaxID=1296 RepID=UPI0028867496|nr:NUMOD4 domain-containing protein [Mammaliicoccus sciuri]MDT0703930.1 NUMOD4 domain-containing protein [Mammaliicoccus sciuri]